MAELEAEAAWIAEDRPQAARKWVEKLLTASARLGDYPYSGKHVEGHADLPVRELVVAPYRIIYLPEPGRVSIITIKHSRQELTDDDLVLSSGEEDAEW
jgi:toxin ParE1/3/4